MRVFCTREILSFFQAYVLFATLLPVILGCIRCGFLWRHEWKGSYLAHANCLRLIQEFLSFLFPPLFSPGVANEPKSRQALYHRTNLSGSGSKICLSLFPSSFPSPPPFPFFLSVCLSGLELTMDAWQASNCSNTPASASWALVPQGTTLPSQTRTNSFLSFKAQELCTLWDADWVSPYLGFPVLPRNFLWKLPDWVGSCLT